MELNDFAKDIKRSFKDAIISDASGASRDAYQQYLFCMRDTVEKLIKCSNSGDHFTSAEFEASQVTFLKLVSQAAERIPAVYKDVVGPSRKKGSSPSRRSNHSNGGVTPENELPPPGFYGGFVSPLEKVREENRRLIELYERKKDLVKNHPSRVSALNMDLHRRIQENNAIARKEHSNAEALYKQRLQAIERHLLVSPDVSRENREFYCKVMAFESSTMSVQFTQMKSSIQSSPTQMKIDAFLRFIILRVPSHPVSVLFHDTQRMIQAEIESKIDASSRLQALSKIDDYVFVAQSEKSLRESSSEQPSPALVENSEEIYRNIPAEIPQYYSEGELEEELMDIMSIISDDEIVSNQNHPSISPFELDELCQYVLDQFDTMAFLLTLVYNQEINESEATSTSFENGFHQLFFSHDDLGTVLLQLFKISYQDAQIKLETLKAGSSHEGARCEEPNELVKKLSGNFLTEAINLIFELLQTPVPIQKFDLMVDFLKKTESELKNHCGEIGADDLLPVVCHTVLTSGKSDLCSLQIYGKIYAEKLRDGGG